MSTIGEVSANRKEYGAEFEWKIKDFKSLSEKDGVVYWSPIFSFGNFHWFLGIYPNGARGTDSLGHADLFLELDRKATDPPVRLDFSIALKTENEQKESEKHFTRDFGERKRHDFLRFISRSVLSSRASELVPSGTLTIVCTMKRIRTMMCKDAGNASNTTTADCCYCEKIFDVESISSHQRRCMERPIKCPDCFKVVLIKNWLGDHECQNERIEGEAGPSEFAIHLHEKKVLHDLKELFLKREGCDVIIKVKGREFLAHKNILNVRCPSLSCTLFEQDRVENITCTKEIEDCDPSSFSDFLYFLYCGDVGMISNENVFCLFTSADNYKILDLKETCVDFMKRNLSVDTFCDTIKLALRHSETDLIKLSTDYFTNNASKIIMTEKWQSFLSEYPVYSNELLVKLLVNNRNDPNINNPTSSKKPDDKTCKIS